MKLVRKFLKLLTVEPVRPLGRWSLDYCTKVLETKVERTNVDHCGPCGLSVDPNKVNAVVSASQLKKGTDSPISVSYK